MKFSGTEIYYSPDEWSKLNQRYPSRGDARIHNETQIAFEFEGRTVVLDTDLNEVVLPTEVELKAVVADTTIFLVKFENKDVQNPQTFEFLCTKNKIISDLSTITETLPQMWLADDYIVVRDGVLDISKLRYTHSPNGTDYITTVQIGNGVHVMHEPKFVSYDQEPKHKILPIEGKAFFLKNNDAGHLNGAQYSAETGEYYKTVDMSHVLTITTVEQ